MRQKIEKNKFIIGEMILTFLLFLRFYDQEVTNYNTSVLAITYEYGFVSRGLIGSIYQGLDFILPWNMNSYISALRFTQIVTMLFYIFMLCFMNFVLVRVEEQEKDMAKKLMVFFTLFYVPMFCSSYNMGRLDSYCMTISIVCIMLLVKNQWKWLVVPLLGISVMIHQGNVFMYVGVVLVILCYQWLREEEKKEGRKNLLLLMVSFGTVSVLFLWFMRFGHPRSQEIYQEVLHRASSLSLRGEPHLEVLQAEILGIDLTAAEREFRIKNHVELPIFFVLFSPYVLMIVSIFVNVIKKAKQKKQKLAYLIAAVGSFMILPDLILKVDYGRWMFVIISYYVLIFLYFLMKKDCYVIHELREIQKKILSKTGVLGEFLLLGYPLLFQPLQHTWISEYTKALAEFVNNNLLHLW